MSEVAALFLGRTSHAGAVVSLLMWKGAAGPER